MTTIYLDELGIVQVDYTSDGRMARDASINRAFLDLADLYEAIAKKAIIRSLRQGRCPNVPIEVVREVRGIRNEILAEARNRNA